MPGLSEFSDVDTEDIQNILVYIVDSLRYDSLPNRLEKMGVTSLMTSPSTHTASSIPSLLTGVYPSDHQVWNFGDTLPTEPYLLKNNIAKIDSSNIWRHIEKAEEKPPMRSLRTSRHQIFEEANPPFTIIKHDTGAHDPYDHFEMEGRPTSSEFFDLYKNNINDIRDLYQSGAESAADRVIGHINNLKERELFDESLVLVLSDHGELLGEQDRGGVFAHSHPMVPELIRVPLVAIGAGLPKGKRLDWHLSGIDLAPTIFGLNGIQPPEHMNGINFWNQSPPNNRVARSECWKSAGRFQYGAGSAWDRNGGVVKHLFSRHERILFAIRCNITTGSTAGATRNNLSLKAIRKMGEQYGKTKLEYGNPSTDNCLSQIVEEFERSDAEYHISGPSKDQLEALGYIE